MQRVMVQTLAPKYMGEIPVVEDAALENRQIRNWLGANCACTWETHISKDCRHIVVHFDDDSAEEDMIGFKLQWL